MNAIINFYKELDTLNLILFWGIIIVVILLLTFSIILINKNKKLKAMLISNQQENEDIKDMKENIDIPVISNVTIPNIEEIKEPIDDTINEQKVTEENDFIAEEHVIEYNKDLFSLANIEKVNIEKENIEKEQKQEEIREVEAKKTDIELPNAPYQRNVLREMSLNQTSPIGIVKNNNYEEKHLNNARELQTILKEDSPKEEKIQIKVEDNSNQKRYLAEVSKKLNEASNLDEIERTSYELKQEEDAIISYQELMEKKDSIHIVDEEDAVISIEELMNRKKQEEKLYNITQEEENNTFIDELKHLRHDL